jgi:hypothetical protein
MEETAVYMSADADEFRMIGIMEFSRLMGVCTNTIRNWINAGKLIAGRHFYQRGRVIRFPSDRESIAQIMQELTERSPPQRPRLKRQSKNTRRKIKLRA